MDPKGKFQEILLIYTFNSSHGTCRVAMFIDAYIWVANLPIKLICKCSGPCLKRVNRCKRNECKWSFWHCSQWSWYKESVRSNLTRLRQNSVYSLIHQMSSQTRFSVPVDRKTPGAEYAKIDLWFPNMLFHFFLYSSWHHSLHPEWTIMLITKSDKWNGGCCLCRQQNRRMGENQTIFCILWFFSKKYKCAGAAVKNVFRMSGN